MRNHVWHGFGQFNKHSLLFRFQRPEVQRKLRVSHSSLFTYHYNNGKPVVQRMRGSYGVPIISLVPGPLRVRRKPITSPLMGVVGVATGLHFLVLLISKVST